MRCSSRRQSAAPPVTRTARARSALTLAAGVVLSGAGWGCADRATAPLTIGGLPEALALRVGEERVLAPTVDQRFNYEWESSARAVADVLPSIGDCDFASCRVGNGVTATVRALAPGQATVRVFAPGRGTGPRTGATAAVVVTVQPAAP